MQTLPTFSGELSRGWGLFAGDTYERDINNQALGFNTCPPEHMLRLWTTYHLPPTTYHLPPTSCQLPGARSAFSGDRNTRSSSYRRIGTVDITAPGRAVRSSYVRNLINTQWQASLNFSNMFDKRYCTSIGNLINRCHYGNPRNVMLKLRGSF
ncbi:TonB-dependent receptor [Comamonas sp.]|uniref:TonB-dependent receptor n=1 Tax=Comamonas sp. TaxID=34028 RepID=UPI0025C256FF|nr:TonB-dependent receptor [Comamonas sp.]